MFEDAKMNEDGILEIHVDQLKAHLGKVHMVDVRRPDEFRGELGHINGAELSTLESALSERLRDLDPSKTYVFVCRSGVRSSKAALMARTRGIENVYNLAGGMIAWNQRGYPVERG